MIFKNNAISACFIFMHWSARTISPKNYIIYIIIFCQVICQHSDFLRQLWTNIITKHIVELTSNIKQEYNILKSFLFVQWNLQEMTTFWFSLRSIKTSQRRSTSFPLCRFLSTFRRRSKRCCRCRWRSLFSTDSTSGPSSLPTCSGN